MAKLCYREEEDGMNEYIVTARKFSSPVISQCGELTIPHLRETMVGFQKPSIEVCWKLLWLVETKYE